MAHFIEKYPLVIQVVGPHLMVKSPDFGEWLAERYEPRDVGQAEMLIRRMRAKLERLIREREKEGRPVPSPTLPQDFALEQRSDLISVSDVARLLQISRHTVWRMAKAGKLKSVETPGGHKRFLRSTVEAILRQRGQPIARESELGPNG